VDGAAGADSLYGGDGEGFITDGENSVGAPDALSSWDSDDFLGPRNVPGGKDAVSCGRGRDWVFADG
jgi:hypothetical protein